MTEFPDGVVTLLFTDIEGSTRLLKGLGDRYVDVLAKHRELMHDAFQAHGGCEVAWQGDSAFVVFSQAHQAVAAATEAQRALQAHLWPRDNEVRVRMGLHTGHPTCVDNDYVGVDVHHAARLMAAASGGQILLSETLLDAVKNNWPAGVKVLSLGRHQLKDMTHSDNLYQLSVDELPAEFPPIKAIDLRPNNLPAPVTPLIGREEETVTAVNLLRNSDVRLLTLTGTGGTGKTRLALHVASSLKGDFENGVFFVALAAVRNPALVMSAIAQTLGLGEEAGQALSKKLEDYLKDKQLLLLLDNFEQVVDAAPVVAELLRACPGIKVLVTSRMALHLRGEYELPVPPLGLPNLAMLPPVEKLAQVAAVELFTQRACAVKPSFVLDTKNATTIATLCTRLEGLPLAIELTAPHLRILPPKIILTRLEKRLTLLTDGARDLPERHQTLRECIAWSFNLLQAKEKLLLKELAVFAGGFTLEAVTAVTNELGNEPNISESLAYLERVNLIKKGSDDRFSILEGIREFAGEQLQAGGAKVLLQRRHAAHFLHVAEKAAPGLVGEGQDSWLQQLDQDQHNLRAALEWSLESEPQIALELAGALWRYWEIRGSINEGRKWLQDALEKTPDAPAALRARALSGVGKLAWHQGDYNASATFFETSMALHRGLNDTKNLATDISSLGLAIMHLGDMPRAKALFEEGLAIRRKLHDKEGVLQLIVELQEVALQCDIDGLRALSEEGLRMAREVGNKRAIAGSLMNLGFAEHYVKNYEEAYLLFFDSLQISREIGEKWYATHALYALGKTLTANGQWQQAFHYLQESMEMVFEYKYLWGIPYVISVFGYIAAVRGNWEEAVRLFGKTQAMCDAAQTPLMPECGREYASYEARARGILDPQTFEICWNEGAAFSLEEALEHAAHVADPELKLALAS